MSLIKKKKIIIYKIDAYSVLEINPNASEMDIKKAYRKLSLKYHPDKCKIEGWTKEQCENEFKILSNEYEAIKKKLDIIGGKKSNKNSNTKKLHNIKRKHKSKSKRIRKSKKNYKK